MASVTKVVGKDGVSKYILKSKIKDYNKQKYLNKSKTFIPSQDLSEPEALNKL